MDKPNTIELTPAAEAPVGAAPRGSKKTSKPTAVGPVATASDQSNQIARSVSKRAGAKPAPREGVQGVKAKNLAKTVADERPDMRHRSRSKKEQLIGLLSKPGGTRVSVLVERLGWQAHTVRAALSGLRKQGIAIAVSKSAKTGETVYAVTSAAGVNEASA